MPLVAHGYVALFIGLVAGMEGHVTAALVVAWIVLIVGFILWNPRLGGAALLLAAGAITAGAIRRRDERCRAQAASLSAWRATLDVRPASKDAMVRGTWREGTCAVPMLILVERGAGGAGNVVDVAGRGVVSSRGITVDHAVIVPVAAASALDRWRAAAGERIDRVFAEDAPLVRALVIADERDIPAAVRQRWSSAGIVHMLSVSGLHVAIVGGTLELLLLACRLGPRTALVAASLGCALYVALIGAPPPAIRSATMLAVSAASRLLQRPTSPWATLAVGATLPLVDPSTASNLGYQLSVAGMAALVAAGAVKRRWIAPHFAGWKLTVIANLATSIIASLVTAPLVAMSFGELSIVAPASNLVADPIMAAALPMVFLTLVLSPVPALASLAASAAHAPLAAFSWIADVMGSLPFATVAVWPGTLTTICFGVGIAAFVVACTSRFPARPFAMALTAVCLAIWLPVAGRRGETELHMIDVGQGDALAFRTRSNRWVLVDAGRSWANGDAGRSTVVPYIRRRGGTVDAFIMSHPHADHIGGAASVLAALHPATLWDPAFVTGAEVYRDVLRRAVANGVIWQRVQPGDSLVVDELTIRVLAPDSSWASDGHGANETSIVLMASVGHMRFLLTGDAEQGEEEWLLAHTDSLRADVLKVGHHGSSTSSSAAFLDAVRPRLALVSVGAINGYGHPSPIRMHDFARRGVPVLRTDRSGTIVVSTDGTSLRVATADDRWELRAASLP